MMLKQISGVSFIDKKDVSRKALITLLSFASGLCIITFLFSGKHWFHHLKKHAILRKNDTISSIPFEVSNDRMIIELGSTDVLTLKVRDKIVTKKTKVKILFDNNKLIDTISSFTLSPVKSQGIFIPLKTINTSGQCLMTFESKKSKELKNLYKIQIHISVVHKILLGYLSVFIGWAYFFSWSFTYYPQIIKNFRTKSVVGLSIDYVVLNFVGHISYLIFNVAFFKNSFIQLSYLHEHPQTAIPVKLNDVYFSFHAVIMTSIIVLQCIFYDRKDQELAKFSVFILCLIACGFAGLFYSALSERITWLSLIYFCSAVKVFVTPIKYFPQVFLNYQRKSTSGYAIQSVLLDGGGGILSFLQMIIDAFNNDDWQTTIGNPGKLCLGLISIMFNVIFFIQHFFIYRKQTH